MLTHSNTCNWHWDQYDWECNCGAIPGAKHRYLVSQYTSGPATRWNVIDRRTQEWIRRFPTKEAAQDHADELNSR